ncbi:MAG: MgtC/SapB family protein [Phenylobacterium sp.]|uniref:MgtC/SapB family protein n=1 Tax=Phenylobacterium sp. TaxID=1871053 RepID=UPI002734BBEF|nr:MgtC/SapB family protein [Phenylobacterium sp.]MDP3175015.1 MgtC/SapB family protein [Phenylobacterium sp.]
MDYATIALDYVAPIAGSVLAGGLIGMEREYRGRPAGLRTHILVSLASTLLMLAAVHQVRWLTDTPPEVIRIDPVRMAHGVLTGIGFLCGGVIFRQGLSVHGLTTAASLWITSALGVLYGIGFFGLAIGGTATALLVLAGFRWFDDHLPGTTMLDAKVRYQRGASFPEAEFRALAAEFKMRPSALSHRLLDEGRTAEISATLYAERHVDTQAIVDRLCADPRVQEFELNPRND